MKKQQGRLFKPEPAGRRTFRATMDAFDEANLRSAKTILADPDQHGGEDAFPAIWARRVVARLEA
jgi:hypothetical protein